MGDPYYEDGNEGNYSDIVLRCHDKDDYYESFISEKRAAVVFGVFYGLLNVPLPTLFL